MPNDPGIRYTITTTADTAGAEKTVAALDRVLGVEQRRQQSAADFLSAAEREVAEVERMAGASRRLEAAKEAEAQAIRETAEAARAEQQALDVLEAKRRVAARGAQTHATATQNFGGVVTNVGYQVTDFATQVSMGTNAFTAFAQQAPQAIGAVQSLGQGMKISLSSAIGLGTGIGIAATAVALGVQVVANEYAKLKGDMDAAKDAENRYQEQLRRNIQLRKDLAERSRADFITESFTRDAEALERQVKALERINELRGAQGDRAAAEATAAVTLARNTGGDVTAAKGNAIAIGVDNQLEALASKLSESEAALATAVQSLDQNRLLFSEAVRLSGGVETQETADANAAVAASVNAVAQAREALESLQAITAEQRAAIVAGAEASISELGSEANQAFQESVKTALAEGQETANQLGGQVSVQFKTGLDTIAKALEDGGVDSAEQGRVLEAIVRMRTSREAADRDLLAALQSVERTNNSVTNTISDLRRRLEIIEAKAEP